MPSTQMLVLLTAAAGSQRMAAVSVVTPPPAASVTQTVAALSLWYLPAQQLMVTALLPALTTVNWLLVYMQHTARCQTPATARYLVLCLPIAATATVRLAATAVVTPHFKIASPVPALQAAQQTLTALLLVTATASSQPPVRKLVAAATLGQAAQ